MFKKIATFSLGQNTFPYTENYTNENYFKVSWIQNSNLTLFSVNGIK